MSKFAIDDMVEMPGIPIPPVKVLEIKKCEEPGCPFQDQEVFRFKDPAGVGEDWMHTAEFELAQG